jgi:hypothetical protein
MKAVSKAVVRVLALLKQGMISSKRNLQKQLTKNLNL